MIEEINSGIDVPTPTIVTPTMKGLNPINKPIFSAASVKKSDPLTRMAKLMTKIKHNTMRLSIWDL